MSPPWAPSFPLAAASEPESESPTSPSPAPTSTSRGTAIGGGPAGRRNEARIWGGSPVGREVSGSEGQPLSSPSVGVVPPPERPP
eukprot:9052427-Pyramimonas_sp.AAC.1